MVSYSNTHSEQTPATAPQPNNQPTRQAPPPPQTNSLGQESTEPQPPSQPDFVEEAEQVAYPNNDPPPSYNELILNRLQKANIENKF